MLGRASERRFKISSSQGATKLGRIGLLVGELDFSMFGGLEQHNKLVVVFCALVYELA